MNNLLFPSNLAGQSPRYQLLWLTIIIVACYCMVSSLAILGLLLLGYDLNMMRDTDFSVLSDGSLGLYKILQIASTIALFIVPAMVFSAILQNNFRYLQMHRPIQIQPTFIALCISLLSFPIIAWTSQINAAIDLPPFLDNIETWMRSMEDEAKEMTIAFLQMNSPIDLLFNLIMVAILPALGEEMLFRGCVQRVFYRLFSNPHVAIWLAAALFSFIHFQFYGFLPRMVIGAILGYLYYFSGNLWYPIIGHFLNNGIQVVAVYFMPSELEKADPGGIENVPFYVPLISVALIIYLFGLFQSQCKTPNTELLNNEAS